MGTIIESLRAGIIPPVIYELSEREHIHPTQFIQHVINGHVVIPRNTRHTTLTPVAIGRDTRVKINDNIGTSPADCDFENEFQEDSWDVMW